MVTICDTNYTSDFNLDFAELYSIHPHTLEEKLVILDALLCRPF